MKRQVKVDESIYEYVVPCIHTDGTLSGSPPLSLTPSFSSAMAYCTCYVMLYNTNSYEKLYKFYYRYAPEHY